MGRIVVDITGKRSDRLVGVRLLSIDPKTRRATWELKCDCGRTIEAHGCRINEGKLRSCGCLRLEGLARARAKNLALAKARREAREAQGR
jgi:hypothetical protein